MNIVPFNRQHFKYIAKWLEHHGEDASLITDIPQMGYMCYYNDKPAAAGFIRLVEGGTGILEGLVANPEFLRGTRSEAIDTLVGVIINRAKELKLRNLIAFSTNKSTLERSLRHGFVKLPHTLIVADLSLR